VALAPVTRAMPGLVRLALSFRLVVLVMGNQDTDHSGATLVNNEESTAQIQQHLQQRSEVSRVLVLRHCVRSTAKMPHIDQWSHLAAPKWGVEDMQCTAGGREIVKDLGKYLAKEFQLTVSRVTALSDAEQRCQHTTHDVLKGMGGDHYDPVFDVNSSIFNTVKEGWCKPPDSGVHDRESMKAFEERPMPMDVGRPRSQNFDQQWKKMLERFHKVIGTGAQDIRTIPPLTASQGRKKILKTLTIFKSIAQYIFYSWASGPGQYEIKYGDPPHNPTEDEIFEMLQWVYYTRAIKEPWSVATTKGVRMVSEVLRLLRKDGGLADGDSSFIVGHDGNLASLAELLDLSWNAAPYTRGKSTRYVTPPNSGLLFSRYPGGDVKIDFVYSVFKHTITPEQKHTPVLVGSSSRTSVRGLEKQLQDAVYKSSTAAPTKCKSNLDRGTPALSEEERKKAKEKEAKAEE